jgi:hypothetical protein
MLPLTVAVLMIVDPGAKTTVPLIVTTMLAPASNTCCDLGATQVTVGALTVQLPMLGTALMLAASNPWVPSLTVTWLAVFEEVFLTVIV